MPKTEEIRLFLGSSTSVDPKNLDRSRSERELNVRHEDGRLAPRRGYNNLQAAQGGFVNTYGLVYLQGYNSSNAETEEYISFEDTGAGTSTAYTRTAAAMASPSAITGATGLPVTGDFTGLAFDDVAYLINKAHTTDVYKHVLGDSTSWVAMTNPADPTTALTYRVDFASGGSSQYATLSWAGTDAADVTVTGSATTTNLTVDSSGNLIVEFDDNTGVFSTIEVDLNGITAGVQDWSYNDIFAFPFQTPASGVFAVDWNSLQFTFTNNDGSPKTIVPSRVDVSVAPGANPQYAIARCYFGNKTRADWDNIRKVKIGVQPTKRSGSQTVNKFTILKPIIGCCQILAPDFPTSREPGGGRYEFGHTAYSSTLTLESGVAGTVQIPVANIRGLTPMPSWGLNVEGLGCWITFTHVAFGDADKVRYYWKDFVNNVWRLLTTQNDGTTTFTLKMDYQEMLAASAYNDGPFLIQPVENAFPYKEWVVWLYGLGERNVRHSRIGLPESQASNLDFDDDENRGATFTLAENYADVPIGGVQVGDTAVIFGANGVFEQFGDRPSEVTPTKRFPGGLGAAGKFAFCRFKDDSGHPVAVFLDRHGTGVWAAYPSNAQGRDIDGRVIELTADVRGLVRTFLLTEQSGLSLTDFSTAKVFADDSQDALWVVMGKRAMVLRRPNTVTDQRQWEFYEYNTGGAATTIKFVAASPKRRIRWMRSNGKSDEAEWNTADSMFVEGINRDGGNPMPRGYWRSKVFAGLNRRILRVFLDRGRTWVQAAVRVISTRKKQRYIVAENKHYARCLADQQGWDHQFEIEVPEMDDAYSRLMWEEAESSRRTNL